MPLFENLQDVSFEREYLVKKGTSQTIVTFNSGVKEIINKLNVNVEEDSTLNIYNVVTSSLNSSINQTINLQGVNAKCNIMNVLLLKGDAKFESHILINHLVNNTNSDFATYAIALDSAYLILDNNATIKKGASKSICHQKAKGLTLSKKAKIKAMPNLFIDEYDVIANHAASIGSINKDDLFYLMSRGLTLKDASTIIVMGFIKPLLDKIDDTKLRNEINENFEKKLTM